MSLGGHNKIAEDLGVGYPKYIGTSYILREKAIILWPLQDIPYVTRVCGVKNYEVCHLAFSQQT